MTETPATRFANAELWEAAAATALAGMVAAEVQKARIQIGYAAVDQLNSWVRSESFRDQSLTGVKKHIYALKLSAIRQARTDGCAVSRREHVVLPCRTCDGTGTYSEWDTMTVSGKRSAVKVDLGRCRRCWGKGTVQLDFISTELPCGLLRAGELIRWHTPNQEWPFTRLDLTESVSAQGWAPGKKGHDLLPEDVAAYLNVADAVFPQPPCRCEDWYRCPQHYGLHIGRMVDACQACGSTVSMHNYHCRSGRVEYTLGFCERCRQAKGMSLFQWPLPAALLTPNVAAWIERNDARSECAQ